MKLARQRDCGTNAKKGSYNLQLPIFSCLSYHMVANAVKLDMVCASINKTNKNCVVKKWKNILKHMDLIVEMRSP